MHCITCSCIQPNPAPRITMVIEDFINAIKANAFDFDSEIPALRYSTILTRNQIGSARISRTTLYATYRIWFARQDPAYVGRAISNQSFFKEITRLGHESYRSAMGHHVDGFHWLDPDYAVDKIASLKLHNF